MNSGERLRNERSVPKRGCGSFRREKFSDTEKIRIFSPQKN
jgi:hypothetical protein